MLFYSQNLVQPEIYLTTLDLIQAIREGDYEQFKLLLPKSDITAMECAAVHVAVQCDRTHMLTDMLSVCATHEILIKSAQGLVWAIEQNALQTVLLLLPHFYKDAIEESLQVIKDFKIIDAIQPHITEVGVNLVKMWCQTENIYALNAFKNKIDAKHMQEAAFEALKTNNVELVEFFMVNCGDVFQNYPPNKSKKNILLQSVGYSVEVMRTVLEHCTDDMRYEALRRSVSFELHEHSNILIENHTYSDDEIVEIFKFTAIRSDSNLASKILEQYPIFEERATEMLACAVRSNNRTLFDHLFNKIDTNKPDTIENAQRAVWWASARNHPEYLSALASKIDLTVCFNTMHTTKDHAFKEKHFDFLRDFIAQQQHDVITSELGHTGQSVRRKM